MPHTISEVVQMLSQYGPNSGYMKELYEQFVLDPALVPESWRKFFSSLQGIEYKAPNGDGAARANGAAGAVAATNGTHRAAASASAVSSEMAADVALQLKAAAYLQAYRERGHLKAAINPLTKGVTPPPVPRDLSEDYYAFSSQQGTVSCSYLPGGFQGRASIPLAAFKEEISKIYCGSIGFEYMHILDVAERQWLQERIENRPSQPPPAPAQKIEFLTKLVEAESLESELHRKYVGSKRFSLQGSEAAIPMLHQMVYLAADAGVRGMLIGMSHRGRLNVLTNIVGKPLEDVFREFEDRSLAATIGSGDVKYHLGYSSIVTSPRGNKIEVGLAPNPSHLEFVNPVVQGMVRARQDQHYNHQRQAVMPVLLHGDAAFVGQGVVYETLNLAKLEGYRCGGTLHIIINNQVGFTTTPDESRSSTYCTDMAKAFDVPVFHVNGEDVEACCWVTALALEFRQTFGRDVIIDLYSYRKYGHNEGDDPSFTQPLSYAEIAEKKNVAALYADKLIAEGVITKESFKELIFSYKEHFEAADRKSKAAPPSGDACPIHGRLRVPTPFTGVELGLLEQIATTLISYPEGFVPHPKLHKILEKRVETLRAGSGIEWGFAEALAFGSLLHEGHHVRLSGQDCGRGTFSHRHLALDHYESNQVIFPLNQIHTKPEAYFEVYNSSLSEAGVVGFEFGYSSVSTGSLVLWEAQFGDFGNGAQVYIDQFISSSEAKWDLLSGIVLLLPHGYEGMGPEHSSARLERYLQLCAEGNMVVAYPSNAGQYFHLLRRQGLMEIKRPLVVMTPKSLLRHPQAACTTEELTNGQFQTVLETDFSGNENPEHIILLTGKVYYDVCAGIEKSGHKNVKVIRMEQLYPFPQYELKKALRNMNARSYIWVQEEPQNMGAWTYIESYLRHKIGVDVTYVGREVSASTATGSSKHHAIEQQKIVQEVLDLIAN